MSPAICASKNLAAVWGNNRKKLPVVGEQVVQPMNNSCSSDGTPHDGPVHLLQIKQTRDAVTHGHGAHGHISH